MKTMSLRSASIIELTRDEFIARQRCDNAGGDSDPVAYNIESHLQTAEQYPSTTCQRY